MKKYFFPVLGIFLGLTLFASPFLIFPALIKVSIECKSQYGDCPPEILSEVSAFELKSLGTARKGIKESLKRNFLVLDYSTHFKLPNILEVNILVKKPAFVLKNSINGEMVTVDSHGSVISKVSSSSLPTVLISGELNQIGEDVSEEDLSALKLMSGVFQMYQVSQGRIENESLVVELPTSVKVIFPLGEDAEIALGSLRLIYTKIQNEYPGRFREIDLRFKNPVLR